MRRTLTLLLLASIPLAACGSDSGSADESQPSDESTPSVVSTPVEDSVETEDSIETEDSVADDPTTSEGVVDGTTPSPPNPDKPTVEIPAQIPTELVVTELVPGEGPEAAEGDTVVVDYIGVRSSDGVEFDNSYDRGEPFPVVLGSGSVIPGWDQGLLGAQAGSRLQLDIPAELAYGADARGDIIGENEALTFVIDVRTIIPATDPADAPTEPGVEASVGATDISTTDVIEGEGPAIEKGHTAVLHLVLFRGDNLVALDSTWVGAPQQFPLTDGLFPGLLEGIPGMKVGGRRAIVIPPDQGFGPEGNPQIGLPADTDLIIVVDLLGIA